MDAAALQVQILRALVLTAYRAPAQLLDHLPGRAVLDEVRLPGEAIDMHVDGLKAFNDAVQH